MGQYLRSKNKFKTTYSKLVFFEEIRYSVCQTGLSHFHRENLGDFFCLKLFQDYSKNDERCSYIISLLQQ
jgi:hypothetical protein